MQLLYISDQILTLQVCVYVEEDPSIRKIVEKVDDHWGTHQGENRYQFLSRNYVDSTECFE